MILKIATMLCYGITAWQYARYSNTTFSYLYIGNDFTETFASNVVSVMIAVLIMASIAVWIPKLWAHAFTLTGAMVILTNAYCLTVYPPETSASFNIVSHAIRVALPVALLFISLKRTKWAHGVLIFGISLTFVGHGLKALVSDVLFTDYLLAFFSDIGFPIELDTAILLLHMIGTFDLLLAFHLCFFRKQTVFLVLRYMMIWGLITALARLTYSGIGAWHEILVRGPHYLVPLALFLSYRNLKSK